MNLEAVLKSPFTRNVSGAIRISTIDDIFNVP